MNYEQLCRLKRIHEWTGAGMTVREALKRGSQFMSDNAGEIGFYLEFDGLVHAEAQSNILFVGSGNDGVTRIVSHIPKLAKVIARRVCPCVMEWDDKGIFQYAKVAVPQLSAFVADYRVGGYAYQEPNAYQGQQWARFAQRGIDVRKFLEANDYAKWVALAPFDRDNGYGYEGRPVMAVDLDDDLRILLKLKFTRARVDA
jgi:hypothetical protein